MSSPSQRTDLFGLEVIPQLADLFRSALRKLRLEMRTHVPCTVISANLLTRTVTVNVDTLAIVKDYVKPATTADPNPTAPLPPVRLVDIPMAVWQTAAGFVTLPVATGDTGELHVADRGLEQWMKIGAATDPISAFTHSLADSVYHPTLQATGRGGPIDPTATVIDGELFVKIGAGAVAPTGFLVRQVALEAAMTAMLKGGAVSGPGAPNFVAAEKAWDAFLLLNPIGTTKALGE